MAGFGDALTNFAKNASGDQKMAAASGIGGAISGILGGIVGGRARRREQKAAQAELATQKAAYQNFEFQNAYANLQNPYEDLKVNTMQADFQAQQQQQTLANTLDALRSGGGGLGAAATAQAMVQQQQAGMQQIAANIGQQEAQNQQLAAQGQARINELGAQGAMDVQNMNWDRQETMFGMAQQRKAAADEARAAATKSLMSGIGSAVGAAAGIMTGGVTNLIPDKTP